MLAAEIGIGDGWERDMGQRVGRRSSEVSPEDQRKVKKIRIEIGIQLHQSPCQARVLKTSSRKMDLEDGLEPFKRNNAGTKEQMLLVQGGM